MADEQSTAGARFLLERILTAFRALRQQTINIHEAMAASSAVFSVLSERFPDLADRYEHYRQESLTSSPLAIRTQQLLDSYDANIRSLEEFLANLESEVPRQIDRKS